MKHKISIIIISILLLATLAFIFSNSMQSIAQSQERSIRVMNSIQPLLEVIIGKGNVTDHLVRKLAHFFEFMAFGIELALLRAFCKKVRFQSIINILFVGFAAAAMDETIQLFTGRGSQVQDIWLDFSGALVGISFTLLIFLIINIIHRRVQLKNQ